MQKTITTDPISKRRIKNFGEEEQYYVRDHHEPIVSREVWEQAKEIRLSCNHPSDTLSYSNIYLIDHETMFTKLIHFYFPGRENFEYKKCNYFVKAVWKNDLKDAL